MDNLLSHIGSSAVVELLLKIITTEDFEVSTVAVRIHLFSSSIF